MAAPASPSATWFLTLVPKGFLGLREYQLSRLATAVDSYRTHADVLQLRNVGGATTLYLLACRRGVQV